MFCRLGVRVSNDFDRSHAGGRYAWVGHNLAKAGEMWQAQAVSVLEREDCYQRAMAFLSLFWVRCGHFRVVQCPSFWPWSLL